MLEARSTFKRLILVTALVAVALAATIVAQPGARAARVRAGSWPCCALTTELLGIQQGQTARLELKNKGERPIPVRIQFVDKEGKVMVQQETTITPGDAGMLEFAGDGLGSSRTELRAQFGAEGKKSIGLLRPALRIVENASGKTLRSMGPEGFKAATVTFGGSE